MNKECNQWKTNLKRNGGYDMVIYGIISLRVVVVYLLIVLIFRWMGKREIGELGVIDLVVFIMIADIGVIAIERYNESFSNQFYQWEF